MIESIESVAMLSQNGISDIELYKYLVHEPIDTYIDVEDEDFRPFNLIRLY